MALSLPAVRDQFAGATLGDRYEVLSEVGTGGQGTVYVAHDRLEGRRVAVKIVPLGSRKNSRLAERFAREFSICTRLEHPNIAKIHQFGPIPPAKLYLVMEYVDGLTLCQLIKRHGRLPERLVLSIARQVAQGLAYVHGQGIVHRDIKPSNILVSGPGPSGIRVVITDFGLARDFRADGLTAEGVLLGTLEYLSPELAQGTRVDGRSDIFQLGVLVFEMLTGKRVREGRTSAEVVESLSSAARRAVNHLGPAYKLSFNSFLACCLAPNPADRYQTAEEVLSALDRLGERLRRRPRAERAVI